MKKLIITIGLPGSGKATWVKKYFKEHPDEDIINLNKDLLRSMLHNGVYSEDREKEINDLRNLITTRALGENKTVIWSDTNLSIVHQQKAKELAEIHGADLVPIDLTYVSIEQCIANDLKRPNSVGERVIRQMYNKYLRPTRIFSNDTALPLAVICDLDNTLSNPMGRDLMDMTKVDEDKVNISIAEIIKSIYGKFTIILMSARTEQARNKTEKWLERNQIPYDILILCGQEKFVEAKETKEKYFQKEIEGKYNILFTLDDDPEVCRLWYSLGFGVLKVGDPDNF